MEGGAPGGIEKADLQGLFWAQLTRYGGGWFTRGEERRGEHDEVEGWFSGGDILV